MSMIVLLIFQIHFLKLITYAVIVCVKVFKDRKIAENLVCRAEKAGYKAIVLTGDTPRLGRRESDIRNRCVFPAGFP